MQISHFSSLKRIEAERIYLRKYGPSDSRLYYEVALRNHGHLARFESGNAAFGILSEDDATRVLATFEEQWIQGQSFYLGVFRRSDDALVAQIYVGVSNERLPGFVVGFFADCEHQGQGFVSEAVQAVLRTLFRELNAHRVSLWCSDLNERCWRLAERCGFLREGHVREDQRFPDGSLGGSFCYGCLQSEYDAGNERTTGAAGNPDHRTLKTEKSSSSTRTQPGV